MCVWLCVYFIDNRQRFPSFGQYTENPEGRLQKIQKSSVSIKNSSKSSFFLSRKEWLQMALLSPRRRCGVLRDDDVLLFVCLSPVKYVTSFARWQHPAASGASPILPAAIAKAGIIFNVSLVCLFVSLSQQNLLSTIAMQPLETQTRNFAGV